MEGSSHVSKLALILVGVMVGLMLTGTAWAVTYLTRTQANRLYLQNTKVYIDEGTIAGGINTWKEHIVECPNGWQAVGGGVDMTSGSADVRVVASAPTVGNSHQHPAQQPQGSYGQANGWYVRMVNQTASAWTYSVAVTCAR
jgi:hypothetical protein